MLSRSSLTGSALLLAACLLLGGCGGTSATAADQIGAAISESAPAISLEAGSAAQASLDKAAQEMVARAGRTVMPSKANPKVTRSGKDYVISYVNIDPATARATLRPGQSKASPYVGIVEYTETTLECRGATRQAAQNAKNCTTLSTRHVKELIRHDGNGWQY